LSKDFEKGDIVKGVGEAEVIEVGEYTLTVRIINHPDPAYNRMTYTQRKSHFEVVNKKKPSLWKKWLNKLSVRK